jgi:uncharacterized phage protein (TIGR01671 family)
MRQIKFRAQDVASNKWLYGDLRHHKNDVCIFEQGGTKGEQVKRDTIGQYTGMHDKNGKEIYEGDIVLVSDWTSVYASDYKGTVRFERGQWVVSYEKYGCEMTPRLFFDDFSDRKTTIIGNIHESKEL